MNGEDEASVWSTPSGVVQEEPSPWEDGNGNVVRARSPFNAFGKRHRGDERPEEDDSARDETMSGSTSSSEYEGLTPRQKAVRGMRRRRLEGSTRKKVMGVAGKLFGVLACCVSTVGSMAQEIVAEPIKDVVEVFKDSNDIYVANVGERGDAQRADLLEIFAGHGNLSGAFAEARRGVLRPRDILFGDDLREAQWTSRGTSRVWYG